jgi:hypothetical protein
LGISLVALSLEIAQTLALGPFNPHIISPEWLVKNGICTDEEVEIRFVPMNQGIAFSFRDVHWQIDFRSLLIASREKSCGELAATVIEKLHHTPIRAVGNNFHYAGTREQWGNSPLPMPGATGWGGFPPVGIVEQLRWTAVFSRADVRIEITLAQTEAGMAVMFNFHRETKSSEEARHAALRFDEDKQTSGELLARLFAQGVTT